MEVPDQLRELPFPLGGVYVSCAFDRQPPGTTALAFNVRAFEPSAFRGRGGSRPGLSKYLSDQASGDHPLQNLGLVVNTDITGLIGTFDADDPDYPTYPIVPIGGLFGPAFPSGTFTPVVGGGPETDVIPDPSSDGSGVPTDGSGGNSGRNRTPHRQVRRGGQGRQVSRRNRTRTSSGPLLRIGSATATFNQSVTAIHTVTLSGVQTGDLIVLVVFLYFGGIDTVTDSAGNTYSTVVESGFLHMQSAVAVSSGTVTVTVQAFSALAPGALHVVNLRNVAASPVDGTSSNSASSSTLWTAGSLTVSAAGTYALAAFVDLSFLGTITFAAGSGFTLRADETWDIIPLRLAIEDETGLSAAVNPSVTVTAPVPITYGAIGATFKAANP